MIPPTATPHRSEGAPRILFFADAGPTVGGGHVMRCLTLAGALAQRGAVCGFCATQAAAAILDVFADDSIERIGVLGEHGEAIASGAHRWLADAVVVDHYGFDMAQEARLRALSPPLMVFDDLRRHHDCDLVLDSNLGRTAADYPGLQSLTGPAFAPVRPAFALRRDAALARRAGGGEPSRILVSLGLTDVGAISARVVKAFLPDLGAAELDVVLGAAAPSLPRLEQIASSDRRVVLHVDAQDMPALTADADLAIGAGGSSSWERCCLGLPTITLVLADNQRPNALALEAAGASVVLEAGAWDFEGRLRDALRNLVRDETHRQAISRVCAKLCDGRGADRVAERLLSIVSRAP